MTKVKNITLIKTFALRTGSPAWKVERVTDSLDYSVGDLLDENTVRSLCEGENWRVTIK